MKIVQLTAENVKKLRVVQIKPDGSMVQITGPNGSGKSSVLDAIWWALAGAENVTSMPIRQGAERAVIRLELGEITITRKFAKGKDGKDDTTSLIVESKEGARFPSPQRMLDDMLGSLSFDPLEFSRMDAKKQLDTIKALVPLAVDVDALDRDNQRLYAERTEVNRLGKSLLEQQTTWAAAMGPEVLPDQPIDITALMSKLEAVGKHNADIILARNHRQNLEHSIVDLDVAVRDRIRQIRELEQSIEHLNQKVSATQKMIDDLLPLPDSMNADDVHREIGEAQAVNARVDARSHHARVTASLKDARDKAIALSNQMGENSQLKAGAIAAAKMPVDGLAFGEGEILYGGVPFAQASSAEQLRVSVAIAMAGNPKLRVLRIKDGSLLDESNLALIASMADDNDFQIWIERVELSAVGIIMENGMVANEKQLDIEDQVLATTNE